VFICNDQCKNCAHYKNVARSYKTSRKCCHFLLDTGKMCQRKNNKCKSKTTAWKKTENAFEIPLSQR
jgi:hypothetical protein